MKLCDTLFFFASAAIAVYCSRMTASSSASSRRVRVDLQILLMCRQFGSWSVAPHNRKKVIGQTSTTWALTCAIHYCTLTSQFVNCGAICSCQQNDDAVYHSAVLTAAAAHRKLIAITSALRTVFSISRKCNVKEKKRGCRRQTRRRSVLFEKNNDD